MSQRYICQLTQPIMMYIACNKIKTGIRGGDKKNQFNMRNIVNGKICFHQQPRIKTRCATPYHVGAIVCYSLYPCSHLLSLYQSWHSLTSDLAIWFECSMTTCRLVNFYQFLHILSDASISQHRSKPAIPTNKGGTKSKTLHGIGLCMPLSNAFSTTVLKQGHSMDFVK